MQTVLFWVAAATAAYLALVLGELVVAGRRVARLEDVAPLADDEMPVISVIVPARDEARNVEEALRSVLAQAGPHVEVIAVEDRSADATGEILERMAAGNAYLRVVRVRELPPGWLGKNHALWLGAGQARGELLLFTDADVVMAPDTIRRAAARMMREGLDHLTLGPRVILPGWLPQLFGTAFSVFFGIAFRPWRARDPDSEAHVGIGAFNLIRADVYHAIGTHRAIAMRPDDDMKLAKLVKRHRFRQELVSGASSISVEWYASLREVVRGLRKNAFAAMDYRLWLVVAATLGQLIVFVWPFVGVWATTGATRWLNLLSAGILVAMHAGASRVQRSPLWHSLFVPVASLLLVVVLWNSVLYTLRHRGIEWRGTHYPLDELRANRV